MSKIGKNTMTKVVTERWKRKRKKVSLRNLKNNLITVDNLRRINGKKSECFYIFIYIYIWLINNGVIDEISE